MEPKRVRTEQPIAAKRRRGPGRPFTQSDPRINRGGVPSEVRAFHNWMRQAFARSLEEGTEDGLTNGEHIIRTLVQKAKEGDMRAIEYVLDRMGGKPLQAVEVGTEFSFNFLSDAERIRIMGSVEKIKRMQAEEDARRHPVDHTSALLPPALERYPQSVYPTGVPPGENATNVPSKPKLHTPEDRPTRAPLDRRAIGNQSACWHGIPKHQCVTCNNI